jgi:membrane protease YdiL (CAAX protease family)
MASLAAVLVVAGWRLRVAGYGEPRAGRALVSVFLWSVVWGFIQQFVLQAFVNRRAQTVFGGRGAVSIVFVACVFAMLHAPNLWLMALTFGGGLLWSYVYQQAPNLFALALSHAVLSWLLVATIPAGLLKGMRAGYNYFI